ncbi:hypothetical protein [Anditalea andensis]|uniref:hypothetical protein n=1 Tax=Anditalea andensis TaxID=1048983 RepID=UPI0013DEB6F2|nr:hypothetical protein [Anditalea andensis]
MKGVMLVGIEHKIGNKPEGGYGNANNADSGIKPIFIEDSKAVKNVFVHGYVDI